MSSVTLPAGAESVLLVMPDPETRVLVAFMLRRLGYRVAEARNGLEAIAAYEAQTGDFDLLLGDAVMPRMNGQDLAERLRLRRPDLPVLLLADAAFARLMGRAAAKIRLNLLRRPFTIQSLGDAVRKALDSGRALRASGAA
jgi:CheY-like chemotaxis protein